MKPIQWALTFAAGLAAFKVADLAFGRTASASVRADEPTDPKPEAEKPAARPAPGSQLSPDTRKPTPPQAANDGWFGGLADLIPGVKAPELPSAPEVPAVPKVPSIPAKGKVPAYPPKDDDAEYETPSDKATFHPQGPIIPWKGGAITMLPLFDPATGLFARLSYRGALAAAARLGGRLLSTEEYDAVMREGYEIRPCTLVNSKEDGLKMGTLGFAKKHDKCVWAQLEGWKRDRPVGNLGKQWIRGAAPGMALNYGWDKVPGPEIKYIQTLGHTHNDMHRDYSQVTMLIFPAKAA